MRDIEAEVRAMRSLDCPVVASDDARVGEAIAAGAEALRREGLASPGVTVPVAQACAARNAAWWILRTLPPEWTVAQALAALEQAPYQGGQ